MVTLISNTRPGPAVEMETTLELGPVPAWSFSTLSAFEECAYRVFISKVKRIAEEQGTAAARGELIHKAAEDYVCGKRTDLIKELDTYSKEFKELVEAFKADAVEVEGEWAFTIEWRKTGWLSPDCWARVKLDAYVRTSPTSARVIDYKTGKKFGNEVKHSQQGLLYAIAAFMRDPDLEYVDVEFWYTDQKHSDKSVRGYTRQQALMSQPLFHNRGVKMTTEKEFNPSPSKYTCKWCSYKKGEFPECKWGE